MYIEEYVEPYKNLFDKEADGFKEGYRFTSSGIETEEINGVITNYISYDESMFGKMLHIKGIATSINGGTTYARIITYDADGNKVSVLQVPTSAQEVFIQSDYNESVVTWNLGYVDAKGNGYAGFMVTTNYPTLATSFRIGGYLSGSVDDIVITIEEKIQGKPEIKRIYKWANTGHMFIPASYEDRVITLESNYLTQEESIIDLTERVELIESGVINEESLPSYWESYLTSKIDEINDLAKTYGNKCRGGFVSIWDMHRPSNLSYGKYSPMIARKIMDETFIDRVVIGGDTQTRGCWTTKDELLNEENEFKQIIQPIEKEYYRVEGNHDRSYATFDKDNSGIISNNASDGTIKSPEERETYVNNISPEEFHSLCYRQLGTNYEIHFDETGTCYYIHDTRNNMRNIFLNTHCVPYEENEDGTAKYSAMWVFMYSQNQFDFLINKALVDGVDDKTLVTFSSHVPPFQEIQDRDIMNGIINAWIKRTSYSGKYDGYGDDKICSSSIDVNFENYKGIFAGYFHGHNHLDSVNTSLGYTVIGSRCDAKEENDSTLKATRISGTVTEQCIPVFVFVCTDTEVIVNDIRIGAGENRIITIPRV